MLIIEEAMLDAEYELTMQAQYEEVMQDLHMHDINDRCDVCDPENVVRCEDCPYWQSPACTFNEETASCTVLS